MHDISLKSAQAREKYKVINTTENLKRRELVHIWIITVSRKDLKRRVEPFRGKVLSYKSILVL